MFSYDYEIHKSQRCRCGKWCIFSEYQSPLRYSIYQCTPSSNNCYQCIADSGIMWCRWLSCRTSTTRVSSTLSRCSRPRSGSSSSWRSYEVFLPQGSVSLSTLRFSTIHYMILQRIRIIVCDTGFEPGTSANYVALPI